MKLEIELSVSNFMDLLQDDSAKLNLLAEQILRKRGFIVPLPEYYTQEQRENIIKEFMPENISIKEDRISGEGERESIDISSEIDWIFEKIHERMSIYLRTHKTKEIILTKQEYEDLTNTLQKTLFFMNSLVMFTSNRNFKRIYLDDLKQECSIRIKELENLK